MCGCRIRARLAIRGSILASTRFQVQQKISDDIRSLKLNRVTSDKRSNLVRDRYPVNRARAISRGLETSAKSGMSVCAFNIPWVIRVMWHRSWRSVVCQGRARDDPAEMEGHQGADTLPQYLCVAENRARTDTSLTDWLLYANVFIGASCRSRLTQGLLAPKSSLRGGSNNTDPAVTSTT